VSDHVAVGLARRLIERLARHTGGAAIVDLPLLTGGRAPELALEAMALALALLGKLGWGDVGPGAGRLLPLLAPFVGAAPRGAVRPTLEVRAHHPFTRDHVGAPGGRHLDLDLREDKKFKAEDKKFKAACLFASTTEI
jgi:hypothetical protein